MLLIRAYQLLGIAAILGGLYSIARGTPLPGPVGSFMVPRSQQWDAFIADAPPTYWRLGGTMLALFGLAIVLMGQGCFRGLGMAAGLVVGLAALVLAFLVRSRYGPYPPRTKGWWWRYALIYFPTIITVQLVLRGTIAGGCT